MQCSVAGSCRAYYSQEEAVHAVKHDNVVAQLTVVALLRSQASSRHALMPWNAITACIEAYSLPSRPARSAGVSLLRAMIYAARHAMSIQFLTAACNRIVPLYCTAITSCIAHSPGWQALQSALRE